jgi:hypothetical protein
MSRKKRTPVSEVLPPLPPEDEPAAAAAEYSAPNTEGSTSAEPSAEETTPVPDPASEHQAEGEEPAAEASAEEVDQAETEAAPEGESQGSETAAGPNPEAEADKILPLSEYVRDVYGDEDGDPGESTLNAGPAPERWFEILFDTVGSGPSFHQGEQVAERDLEFLGVERLLEIRAIREL